jgi:hypothetical protein
VPVQFDPAVVVPIIAELLAQRHALAYIARALELRSILTPGGAPQWAPMQVSRLIKKYQVEASPSDQRR